MPKFAIPNGDGIFRLIKKIKNKNIKFIFTLKQWGYLFLVFIFVGILSGGLTWFYFHNVEVKNQLALQKSELMFKERGDTQLFEIRKIVVPLDVKGTRDSKTSLYRAPRENWSEKQIRGVYGEGEWTDPSVISSDIFSQKSDLLIKKLMDSVD